jgi:hypothetical protein
MISLICFEHELILTKEEAERLDLKYTRNFTFGLDNDNKIEKMNSWCSFKEDCIKVGEKYYQNQAKLDKNEPEASHYLYTRYFGDKDYVLVAADNHLVDLSIFAPKCKHKFYIKETIISHEPTINNIQAILQLIEDKTTSMNMLVDKIKDNTFNSRTNVHVGGGLITTYNDLMLKENSCTDEIQTELNNGWRIIAVCSQPDQRRPDYILGRYNPQLKVSSKPNADR